MTMRFAAFTLSLIIAAGAPAQPSRGPAPPEMLQGKSLVVERANFSIALPGDGWQWEQLLNPSNPAPDSPGTYVAVNPHTTVYYIVTLPGGKIDRLNDEFVRGAVVSSAPGYFAVLLVSAGVAALVNKSRVAGAILPLIIEVAIARYNSREA
jgi:hypothetical protein